MLATDIFPCLLLLQKGVGILLRVVKSRTPLLQVRVCVCMMMPACLL
jgi:hypothetical protein